MKQLAWSLLCGALLAQPLFAADELPEGAEGDSAAPALQEEPASPTIYRSLDDQGRPVFSDQPPTGRQAEPVEVREQNILPLVRPVMPPAPPGQGGDDDGVQYRVAIVAPPQGETFHNPELIQVQASVTPAMGEGQSLRVLDNGTPGPLKIEWPDRGEHRLVVQLLDEGGEVLAESNPVTVYVHRVSLLRPTP